MRRHLTPVLAPLALAVALAVGVASCSSSEDDAVVVADQDESAPGQDGDNGSTTTGPSATDTTDTTDTTDVTTEDDPGDVGEPPPACSLLTQEDAEEAFEEPASAVEDRSDECSWSSDGDLKMVALRIRTPDLDEWRLGHDNDAWEPIDHGDEGFVGLVFDSIEFRVGDVVYEINVNYSTSGDPDEIVRDLADLVESRL